MPERLASCVNPSRLREVFLCKGEIMECCSESLEGGFGIQNTANSWGLIFDKWKFLDESK